MKYPLIVVVGPTGSGKSGLAIELAVTFCGEVVNCDSVQVYRGLDIGSAKPSRAERQQAVHHLMDVAEPNELFTAGEFLVRGRAALNEIRGRQRLPIVAGGTGLYLRALLEGLFEGPKRSEGLRARLHKLAELKGAEYLHRLLARVDPNSASRMSVNDKPKMVRALEVFFLTSVPLSQQFLKGRNSLQGFAALKIGLNPARTRLYDSINRRVEQMFSGGLLDEVRGLLARGFAPDVKPLQSLGYIQAIRHLQGKLSLEESIAQTQQETRGYAKRQLTWFRNEKDVVWFGGFGSDSEVRMAVKHRVQEFIERCGDASRLLGNTS
jgi:tRNA dimethylallyltransferase